MGYVIGGVVGDRWAKASPLHGRTLTAQVSVLIGFPLYYIIFERIPREATMSTAFLFLIIFQGLTGCWAKVACNKPIFLEIVPKHSIGSAIAWANAIEKTS